MTIEKPELHIINNTHQQKTMAELKKLLDQKNMTQAELGSALKRDKTTINRWSKNSREITWDNAIKIAEVLSCHPVEVFQPKQEIVVDKIITNSFICDNLEKQDKHTISVPFEFYKKGTKAIQVNIPGSFLHKEIFLYDLPKTQVQPFSKNAISNLCYLTCSAAFKKSKKNAPKKNGEKLIFTNKDVVGIVYANGDGTLKVINPLNKLPITESCSSFNIDDIDICVPIKAKYNPDLL